MKFTHTQAPALCGYCCDCVGDTALLFPSRQPIFRSEIFAKMFLFGLDWWYPLLGVYNIAITGPAMGRCSTTLEQPEYHCSFLRFWSFTVDLYRLGMEGAR